MYISYFALLSAMWLCVYDVVEVKLSFDIYQNVYNYRQLIENESS